ncbi:MAG TPA: GNAT family N-acetyltransferase [bacterium]|nr:GNAT family N-acetyltransferase [bacterium]
METTGLRMILKNLEGVPQHPLPEGFSLRFYKPADEQTWVNIHKAADSTIEYSVDLFRKEFPGESALLEERQYYLCDKIGTPIGTATAWFHSDYFGLDYGLVHWVAIVPEYQGKGLSKPLMSAVCMRLKELGHSRARLATSTARLPAVNLYLKLGFVPDIQNEKDVTAWRFVMSQLHRDRLECLMLGQ